MLYGAVEFRQGLQLTNPEYELLRGEAEDDDVTVHTGRIVPIYEKIGTLSTRQQRTLLFRLLTDHEGAVPDPVPESIRARRALPDRWLALRQGAFPPARGRRLTISMDSGRRRSAASFSKSSFCFRRACLNGRAVARASASRTPSPSTIASANRRGRCCPSG